MNESAHPTFDSEEQQILSAILADDDGEMQAVDAATEDGATAPADAPAEPATPAAPVVVDAAPVVADAQPPAATEQPQGDVKAALRAARRSEARTKAELEKARQEIEELRKAVPVAASEQDFTPEELASMQVDFPAQYKLYVKQQELAKQIAETRAAVPQPATTSDEFQPIEFNPVVQELVDQVPDLLTWQHDPSAQDKLKRAIAYDVSLQADPDWADKPLLERFAEAVERTKRAFGVKPVAPNPAAPPAHRTDPAAAIAALKPAGPKSISDFGGGQPASAPTLDYSRMTDEDVLASLSVTQ
ncbi:hypothetical protein KBW71_03295 [Hydrogenophaga aromaticivorans]|uniref:hypothetical protein n=1 Tax=Hydrogenophaga aromaticivorans TaxID=2610898 RepID=UPI001B35B0DB|nr:hypothetical protein [Hydrogenophaga aromaticivorans]MBQ0917454.1 hypothetical protein [Hydrogenophaga aromaticivorans]